MSKKITILILLSIIITSCEFPKTYEYVEIVMHKSIFGDLEEKEKEPVAIRASNDSLAYIEVYQKFCIALKVNQDMIESFRNGSSTPIGFKLLNNDGIDITNSVYFADKDKVEKDIKERIFAMPNSLKSAAEAQSSSASITKAEAAKKAYENRLWKLSHFTDEFGDPTNNKFIYTDATGTFSNSATSGEILYVNIKVTRSNIGIFLRERRRSNPAEKFIGTGTIKLKNSVGEVITVFASDEWNQSGGISIDTDYVPRVKAFFKKSVGEIKIVVQDKYSSIYRFNVDATGYTSEYSRL